MYENSNYQLVPIGEISEDAQVPCLQLYERYIPALRALGGFSHLLVLYWLHEADMADARGLLEVPKPYKTAPETMGIFATRAPVRPNPIGVSVAEVLQIKEAQGLIRVTYLDAFPGTPVLDIKPYTPSMDRVEAPGVPEWCSHWPMSTEASGAFHWEGEFEF